MSDFFKYKFVELCLILSININSCRILSIFFDIYQINENKVHKLNIKMVKTNENILIQNESGKNIKFLIDDSIIKKELVYQIPYEHISISLHVYKYSLNKTKISLVLVVEFIQNNKGIMIPINYYFEYNPVTSNNNIIPAEDINVFLSLLN